MVERYILKNIMAILWYNFWGYTISNVCNLKYVTLI